ncbi:response regulator transcription factor [Pantoea sp.]|uniref:response regulator transcription factor n=1 Tax=Pantoea sp. TaxID=69393 RepID=UPI00289BE3E6|nr:response regulator transcription factor [Pantoea sp.]
MPALLIVDDHPAICFALKVLLEEETTFQPVTCGGERLLPLIRECRPEIVILDIELNGCDGMDMLPRIKQLDPAIKVLVMTSQPEQLYAARAFQAGAEGFVNKQTALSAIVSLCQLLAEGYRCFPACAFEAAKHLAADCAPESPLARLSDREMAVLRYLKQGQSHQAIASLLCISAKTVSTYKTRMLEKSGGLTLEALFDLLEQVK